MRIFRELNELPRFTNAIITIGTFDGVHLGHQKLISRINDLAAQKNGESVILTFHPHPRLVVYPQDTSLKLLNTIDEKIALLTTFQVHTLVVVPFSRYFSDLSPETYIADFLVKHFQPACIVIGYDHKFGKDRIGDITLLKNLSPQYGYEVIEISKQTIDDIAISSTNIRKALQDGDIHTATHLLGHSYKLTGLVVKGLQNGCKIGYPTANIQVQDVQKLIPRTGIYAVKVHYQQQVYKGMLSIGYNPTFEGKEKTIEVNIIDFNKDIYGEELTLEFIAYIRAEKKFDSIEALIVAIDADKVATQKLVTLHSI